jgi:tetratricopeptide (TPR) repeat protein
MPVRAASVSYAQTDQGYRYNGACLVSHNRKRWFIMRWQKTEFLCKGLYLGLLLYIALQGPSWADVGQVALITLAGLALCLAIAAYGKLREGYRVRGRVASFILFLLLDNPGLVYAGVLIGLAVGAFSIHKDADDNAKLAVSLGIGAALGVFLSVLRDVRDRRLRRWLGLGLAAALVGGAIAVLWYWPDLLAPEQRHMIGVLLLLGIGPFYLLTFAGMVEESEVEIAAICAALGIGLWILGSGWSPVMQGGSLVLPVFLYYIYTRYILSNLRVSKHVLRALSFARIGRHRLALQSLSRALKLDPHNVLARETLWHVHRQLDLNEVVQQPETLALVNYELCLERVASLLLPSGPSAAHLQEAHRLLDLVASQRPDLLPRCDYWRAVALTHQRQYVAGAESLIKVLASIDSIPENPQRLSVLFAAWQLALVLHPELNRRAGTPQLKEPGRRLEAIAAVERRLAESPDDASAWDLKRILYSELTEAGYQEAAGAEAAARGFDHAYVQQLGLALINDPGRWQRGGEYLRMAARGLPAQGPTLHIQIAKASERAGDIDAAWHNYELAKRAGRAAGPKNLTPEDRHGYFAVVKMLAESALAAGNNESAIENYKLYSEHERAGVETYRALAELYKRAGDVWAGLRCTEQGLMYNSEDKDLLRRKDEFYYSIKPAELKERLEQVQKWFDVSYCLTKARALLDRHASDLDLVDWAAHLAELVQVAQPGSIAARVLRARLLRIRGEIGETIAALEELRRNKPEKFASDEDEDAWYMGNRLLGDLYLEDKPDLAVECFTEFRKSSRSGADTMYKLGRAYESLGDRVRAVKCYKQVVAFDSHPLAPEAHDALQRLQATS